MDRRQHGQCGQLTRHSLFSPLHRIILMKMPCTSLCTNKQTKQTSTATDIDEARSKLFAKKSNVQLIPPTKCSPGAARLTSSIPGQTCLGQAPTLPSPTDWGWIKTSGMYKPLWTTLPEASKICRIVSCSYKEGCVKKCKCMKARLECTHCVRAVVVGCSQN